MSRPFRTGSLLWTFTGAFLGVLILGVVLQAVLVMAVIRPAARHWAESQAEILARAGAEAIARALKDDPAAQLDDVLSGVNRGRGPVLLIYRDVDGKVLAADRRPGGRRWRRLDSDGLTDRVFPEPPPETPLRGRRIAARAPVELAGQTVGEVVAFIPAAEAWRWPEGIPRPAILFLPVAALLAGSAGFALFRILAGKLRRLEEHAARVAAGDLTTRIPDPGSDEIGRLALGLNRMSESLQQARDKVDAADHQRRRFLADVTHELATPLTSIRGFAEILLDPNVPISEEERGIFLKDIQHEARRMDALVADLLDLARLEGGSVALDAAELDFDGLCRQCVRRFQPLFDEAGLILRISPELARPIPFWGDERRLEQVVANLLQNELRYVPGGRSVLFSLAAEAGRVRLTVEDDGPGFPPQELPLVFDRFYRGDRSRPSGGTGLGLSIVREIARMHGGEARAENRAEGGARLSIELPGAVPGSNRLR